MLKPGAKLVLELPCLDKVYGYIAHCVNEGIPIVEHMTAFAFWGDPRYRAEAMCHKWGYNVEGLMAILSASGFADVKSEEPRYHFPVRDMRITGVKHGTS